MTNNIVSKKVSSILYISINIKLVGIKSSLNIYILRKTSLFYTIILEKPRF